MGCKAGIAISGALGESSLGKAVQGVQALAVPRCLSSLGIPQGVLALVLGYNRTPCSGPCWPGAGELKRTPAGLVLQGPVARPHLLWSSWV
ncbi:UNVERIFIED_CONTAM: hypothetical protein FKN15_049351 [Acipenser sinensis]